MVSIKLAFHLVFARVLFKGPAAASACVITAFNALATPALAAAIHTHYTDKYSRPDLSANYYLTACYALY